MLTIAKRAMEEVQCVLNSPAGRLVLDAQRQVFSDPGYWRAVNILSRHRREMENISALHARLAEAERRRERGTAMSLGLLRSHVERTLRREHPQREPSPPRRRPIGFNRW